MLSPMPPDRPGLRFVEGHEEACLQGTQDTDDQGLAVRHGRAHRPTKTFPGLVLHRDGVAVAADQRNALIIACQLGESGRSGVGPRLVALAPEHRLRGSGSAVGPGQDQPLEPSSGLGRDLRRPSAVRLHELDAQPSRSQDCRTQLQRRTPRTRITQGTVAPCCGGRRARTGRGSPRV